MLFTLKTVTILRILCFACIAEMRLVWCWAKIFLPDFEPTANRD